MEIEEIDYFKTELPCIYCGSKKAEIEFSADSPNIHIHCGNCGCHLPPYDEKKFIQVIKELAKKHWEKIMNNTNIKKRNCPFCNQDWNIKDKVEFSEYPDDVINGSEIYITCLHCYGVSPHISLSEEDILKIKTQSDCEEIIKDKIIEVALTKKYKKA